MSIPARVHIILVAAAGCILGGCRTAAVRQISGQYVSPQQLFEARLSEEWEISEEPEKNIFLFRRRDGVNIAVHVSRDRPTLPLAIQSRELLLRFRRKQVISQNSCTVAGHPAVMSEVVAEVDSPKRGEAPVNVRLRTCVLKAHGQIYDLACWAAPSALEGKEVAPRKLSVFDQFLAEFKPLPGTGPSKSEGRVNRGSAPARF